jgi:hypothetical protein
MLIRARFFVDLMLIGASYFLVFMLMMARFFVALMLIGAWYFLVIMLIRVNNTS